VVTDAPKDTALRAKQLGEHAMRITKASGNWEALIPQLAAQDSAGVITSPQVFLRCQGVSMATKLAEGIPETATSLLADETEVIELGNGEAGARFSLRDGKDMVLFLRLLAQGNSGIERVPILGGIAIRLPFTDRESFKTWLGRPILVVVTRGQIEGEEDFICWL
jgi:hypothetical protein